MLVLVMEEKWKSTSHRLVVLLAIASGFVPMACAAVGFIKRICFEVVLGGGLSKTCQIVMINSSQ